MYHGKARRETNGVMQVSGADKASFRQYWGYVYLYDATGERCRNLQPNMKSAKTIIPRGILGCELSQRGSLENSGHF